MADNKKNDGTAMVQGLISALSGAMVYTDVGNLETNKRLWDRYAQEWEGSGSGTQSEWVQEMAARTAQTSKDPAASASQPPPPPTIVGEEWSSPVDLDEVVKDFITPYLRPDATVVEVGVGGGRVATRVLGHCAKLSCLDISAGMLSKAKALLLTKQQQQQQQHEQEGTPAAATTELDFVLLNASTLPLTYPARLHGTCDFVYCFDVLPHVDLHTMHQSIQQIRLLLKPGAKAFLSTANLLTPAGWRRFACQRKYTAGGFYFVSPDIVQCLLRQAGLKVIKTSSVPAGFKELRDEDGPAQGNLYYGRDFLVVVERPLE